MVVLFTMSLALAFDGGALDDGFESAELGATDSDELVAPPYLPWRRNDNVDPYVVNGQQVEPGDWDDAVGIVFGNYVGCTGTLIAPDVVITAAHCIGGINKVVIGSTNWIKEEGEVIRVERSWAHPSYNGQAGFDVGVLLLAEESSYKPRPIAIDCIAEEYLKDGAQVTVVGYGSTDIQGNNSNSKLNEGVTYIEDADCSSNKIDGIATGCVPALRDYPGELGAGGNEVDSCFGDSGGPLYLNTPEGDFLAGVVSRSYIGVPYNKPCLYGGIYVRPDAVFDWLEEKTGRTVTAAQCNAPPAVAAETLFAKRNGDGTVALSVTDEEQDGGFEFEVVEDGAHGTATVSSDGVVTYVADADYKGDDVVVVRVTDSGDDVYERSGPQSTDVTVNVSVGAGIFAKGKGCGCDSSGTSGFAGLLGAVALLVRRRK